MKKLISLLIVLLILTGCVAVDNDSVYNSLLETIDSEESKLYSNRVNNITYYVDYYMPSDLSESDCDNTTYTFKYNNSIIVYNINIADIINSKYYTDSLLNGNNFFNQNYLILNHTGTLSRNEGDCKYSLEVYKVVDDYLIAFYDVDSTIYAYTNRSDVREVLRNIYIIAKCVETDEEKIINDFSDKDVISATKKTVDLFSYEYPSDGYLSDLIKTNTTTSSTDSSQSQQTSNKAE